MSANRRTEFPAVFFISINEETGEEFYLPTDKEIDEDMTVAREDFKQKLDEYRENGQKEETLTRMTSAYDAGEKADRARRIRSRDIAKANQVECRFTLVKPDYGDFLRIRAEAMVQIQGAPPEFDFERYKSLLLQNDGVKHEGRTLTADEIDGLPALIGRILGERLARAVEPDRRRMLFTSRRSGEH